MCVNGSLLHVILFKDLRVVEDQSALKSSLQLGLVETLVHTGGQFLRFLCVSRCLFTSKLSRTFDI